MSRYLGAAGAALIKRFETLRLVAYKPTPNDVWTIGWGHTKGVQQGDTCTPEQAEAWFQQDTAAAVTAVDHETSYILSQNQFDALVSFGFNVGIDAEAHSTMMKLIQAGDLAGAADEFPKWVHQGGIVLDGLKTRRAAERALFLAV